MNIYDPESINGIFKHLSIGFEITSLIKNSGQRVVYAGHRADKKMKAVIKICDCPPSGVPRIQRELKILNGIESPYFPTSIKSSYFSAESIFGYCESIAVKGKSSQLSHSPIRPFLVTIEEHIEHVSWKDALTALRKEANLIAFLHELFTALGLLWSNKIAHRDLKPDNILIRPNMSPVVIDLGIAKSFRDGTANLTNPMFRTPYTPSYASPEQLTNEKDKIDYKSDQFSVGVIIFEILTGSFPYGNIHEIGEDGVAANLKAEKPIYPPALQQSISSGMRFFMNRLLAVQPYKRFRRSEDILIALRNIEKQ